MTDVAVYQSSVSDTSTNWQYRLLAMIYFDELLILKEIYIVDSLY